MTKIQAGGDAGYPEGFGTKGYLLRSCTYISERFAFLQILELNIIPIEYSKSQLVSGMSFIITEI